MRLLTKLLIAESELLPLLLPLLPLLLKPLLLLTSQMATLGLTQRLRRGLGLTTSGQGQGLTASGLGLGLPGLVWLPHSLGVRGMGPGRFAETLGQWVYSPRALGPHPKTLPRRCGGNRLGQENPAGGSEDCAKQV